MAKYLIWILCWLALMYFFFFFLGFPPINSIKDFTFRAKIIFFNIAKFEKEAIGFIGPTCMLTIVMSSLYKRKVKKGLHCFFILFALSFLGLVSCDLVKAHNEKFIIGTVCFCTIVYSTLFFIQINNTKVESSGKE